MISVSSGFGILMSSLAVQFRDIKIAMPFVIRMLMYTAPIVYSAQSLPEKYRLIYSLNPIVSVIEGLRSCFLGTPFQWNYIIPGMITAFVILVLSILFFKRMERIFVDIL
jgi:lipopolysaccharide transport system permease protein